MVFMNFFKLFCCNEFNIGYYFEDYLEILFWFKYNYYFVSTYFVVYSLL